MRNLGWFVAIGSLVVVLIVLSTNDDRAKPASPEAEARWETALGGAATIHKMMRDPDSLKFASVGEMADGSYCYTYRARNGFGGMDASHAVLTKNAFLGDGDRGFAQAWRSHCTSGRGVEKAPEMNEAMKMIAERE